jgi:helitron helicase-like protein
MGNIRTSSMTPYDSRKVPWDMGCLQNVVKSLTADNINDITDSTINPRLQLLRSVGTHDPHSFASKMTRRAEVESFWFPKPADITISRDWNCRGCNGCLQLLPLFGEFSLRLCTSNPAAVAEFFHYLCEAFFSNLLRSGSDILGIFGDVSAHYGVVETNGRGMFHIHCLIWLGGDFSDFARRLITFLESIITNTMKNASTDYQPLLYQNVPDFTAATSDDDFYRQLLTDTVWQPLYRKQVSIAFLKPQCHAVLSMEIRANVVLECRGNWFQTRLSTILESYTFKEPTVGLTPIILPSSLRFNPIMTFLGFQQYQSSCIYLLFNKLRHQSWCLPSADVG